MGLNVQQRMHAVMKACTYVQKDRNKVAGQYTAVKHDDVTAKIRPYLLEHGLIMTSSVVSCDIEDTTVERKGRDGSPYPQRNVVARACVCQEIINIDDPKDRVILHSHGMGEDQGDKAVGKAISYACKYGILKAFLLETGDDADHDASIEVVRQQSAPTMSAEDSKLVWDAYHAAKKAGKGPAWKALLDSIGYTPGADREPIRLFRATALDDALKSLAELAPKKGDTSDQ